MRETIQTLYVHKLCHHHILKERDSFLTQKKQPSHRQQFSALGNAHLQIKKAICHSTKHLVHGERNLHRRALHLAESMLAH